ncbi:winged helix-turn-helix domain-containing protein [Pontibacillus salipaludis]|uniref:Replication protein n=1 Tax=Pontibacillus salipaludis TaxID=1697394 RepID=A0ABQ1QKY1_9BACI|nr:winged helix-turn-helix domain-containing protein [Pontibacillus salipaludis]GGD29663.1 hypothetical protein GCM10011389_41520 [Pontibacillus salipaludis]
MESSALDQAKYHAWFQHRDSDGWITVASKGKDSGFKQWHYKPQDLADELTKSLGEDVYFSQNTFFKPARKIENIRQLRSLYIDLDFYILNYQPSWVLANLEHEFYKKTVPEPNIIIFSGRGVVLIWLIEPVPSMALPLWQAVQDYLLKELEGLGGDPKATDAARVFRIAGSINSKNGAEVHAQFRHDYRYELRQLQFDYLPELEPEIKPPKKKKRGRKNKVAQLFNTYTLHGARLKDVVTLVNLRNYEVTGYREILCFLYRYWSCCFTKDPTKALNDTITFNLEFTEPLPCHEVERATKSAEKAWEARSNKEANRIAQEKGYPGAGYNITNKKLISWLGITGEEQYHLKTIIDTNEKKRRNKEYQKKKRRDNGVLDRKEYLDLENEKTQMRLKELLSILNSSPEMKNRDIAKKLGISISYVKKLKAKVK